VQKRKELRQKGEEKNRVDPEEAITQGGKGLLVSKRERKRKKKTIDETGKKGEKVYPGDCSRIGKR